MAPGPDRSAASKLRRTWDNFSDARQTLFSVRQAPFPQLWPYLRGDFALEWLSYVWFNFVLRYPHVRHSLPTVTTGVTLFNGTFDVTVDPEKIM